MKPDRKSKLKLGMVTYLWGAQWDLPTLITNCEKTGFAGVELRSTHKHGVEVGLNRTQRAEVKSRFADSPVTLVGLGSACEYHSADHGVVQQNIGIRSSVSPGARILKMVTMKLMAPKIEAKPRTTRPTSSRSMPVIGSMVESGA